MFWRAVARDDPNSPEPSLFDRSQGPHAAGAIEGVSFSGHERNNLLLSAAAQRFDDVSGLSGMDHPADGRAMGVLDYDRDGWVDFAVVNANAPSFQLFRNRIGEIAQTPEPRRMLALRFVGANDSARPDPARSNRGGYGARVEIDLGEVILLREHRAGEGFSSQNSRTLLVGLGQAEGARGLRVVWPSGAEQRFDAVPGDRLVTLYENPAESPDGSGLSVEPYRQEGLAARARQAAPSDTRGPRLELAALGGNGSGDGIRVRVFTTMATWCDTCKGELPQIELLRRAFGEELALVGVPVDEHDSAKKLADYREEFAPAYQLLDPLPEPARAAVQQQVQDALRIDALPATIVTDASGRVLRTSSGVPSVSELRAFLADGT